MSIESELELIQGDEEFLIVEDAHEWAKNHPQSALHKALEWSDRKAGYEYRLWQIRTLVRVHLRNEEGVRTMVSLSIDRGREGGGFRRVSDVLRERGLYEIMLADCLAELKRIELKYSEIKALKPIWSVVERIRRRRARKEGKERPSKQA